jgi:hypothetical protein
MSSQTNVTQIGMSWFGASWGAACCTPERHVATPVGLECSYCSESIQEGDQGFVGFYHAVLHLECLLRQAVGSVAHQRGTCSCYGGAEEDPPGMTLRQAARAAVENYEDSKLELALRDAVRKWREPTIN